MPQIYVTQGLASGTVSLAPNVAAGIGTLVSPTSLVATQLPNSVSGIGCSSTGFLLASPVVPQAAITTDQNFGTLEYGDPYPSDWARTLTLCQEATASIPVPNSTSTATFLLVDTATVAPSSTPLAPVVLPVQNPIIDSAGSLFGATAANSNIVTLNWTAPTGTVPFAYTVRVYVQTTVEGEQSYTGTGAAFSTSATSITLPPLAGGNTYVFALTADADGNANIQTSPYRSALPTGYATVVSGPVTISSAEQMPAIHGDRSIIERFSRPLSHDSSH